MKIIDITQELFSSRIFPGHVPPTYERFKALERGDECNLTNISLSVHNGTHVDAPKHFVAGGKAMHEVDLSVFYGDCTVAEFSGLISGAQIAEVLKACRERLILKGECQLSDEAATAVANSHVRLIGVEDQSVGVTESPRSIHMILLGKGIIPLEGLDLSAARPGEYILSAFPLQLRDSDGSPVRAVLIEME